MSASSPCVEICSLKKSFGLKPVLRGIDLTVEAGERAALLGPNGAGKTTLLRILAALTKPNGGRVSIAGRDIVEDAQQVRSLVGFVAHQPYLYDELTALENLLFFARMYSVRNGRARALALLSRVGLERKAGERVGTFSRGQAQRLSLARALLHSPRLLLLDEPDTGRDEEGTLLDEHRSQGGTLIFTTHRLERAMALSDTILMLHNGRVVYRRPTHELGAESVRQVYQEVLR